ncbi:MAG: PAS domain-containing protein [Deltaproteobacteria bacterium]|nr:PAS domain-containing protein [Deltaproteobacteria bacterium]
MNDCGFYSLLPDAPDTFIHRAPFAAEMKQRLIVFIDNKYADVLTATVGVYPGVEGVIISISSQMALKEIRPTLWHVSITEAMTGSIHEMAELFLALVRGQVKSRALLQKEMALTRDVAMELQNKNQLLQGITSNFPGTIFQFCVRKDKRIDVTYISDGVEEMLGISQLAPQMFDEILSNIHPDDKDEFFESLLNLKGDGRRWQREIRYFHRNGDAILLRWVATLTCLGSTRVFNGVVLDISQEVRLNETVVQSEKMMSIGGLAAGMAHEINNPLAGMMQSIHVLHNRLTTMHPANLAVAQDNGMTMDMLLGYYLRGRNVLTTVSIMKEACERVSTIVRDMLSFARSSGQDFWERDVCELLEQTINIVSTDYDLTRSFDFRRIRLNRVYDDNLPLVSCLPGKLQQVFMNILKNGAEAMNEAAHDTEYTPEFSISVRCDRVRKWLTVQIADNGPGMSPETQRKIFDPFFTTKQPGEGTGLGLSVSYFIITREHEGELSVESTPGKGTCFTIGLPVGIARCASSFS